MLFAGRKRRVERSRQSRPSDASFEASTRAASTQNNMYERGQGSQQSPHGSSDWLQPLVEEVGVLPPYSARCMAPVRKIVFVFSSSPTILHLTSAFVCPHGPTDRSFEATKKLPEHLPAIKDIDTGVRTACLLSFDLRFFHLMH